MSDDNLLCYEMNDEPLPELNGFPLRLIAPGWYGVANVKWLTRIQVVDQRYTGKFMARDYVTIRELTGPSGETVWTFANVNHFRLKSAPAKVVRRADNSHVVVGAAWGAPIAAVEVRIDDGSWTACAAARTQCTPTRSRQLCLDVLDVRVGPPCVGHACCHVTGVRCRRRSAATAR